MVMLSSSKNTQQEELAARTAIEQSRANRLTTFMYLGVPIEGPSILLGDNESVVKGATITGN